MSQTSILPAPSPNLPFSMMGTAARAAVSPAAAAIGAIQRQGQASIGALGFQAPAGGYGAGTIALYTVILGVTGYLSYEAGKAMAPRGSKKSTWGWVGVPVGLLTGPIGLGIMGIVSNQRSGG